jgi:hypothetical protein
VLLNRYPSGWVRKCTKYGEFPSGCQSADQLGRGILSATRIFASIFAKALKT